MFRDQAAGGVIAEHAGHKARRPIVERNPTWSVLSGVVLLLIAMAPVLFAPVNEASAAEMEIDDAAALFGRMPAVWGMRLSPDGQQVVFLRTHSQGFPVAMVINLATGGSKLVLASDEDEELELSRCQWANNTRVLCGYYGTWIKKGKPRSGSRLVAVNTDGSKIKTLAQDAQRGGLVNHQDNIIDIRADDPKHIWMGYWRSKGAGVDQVGRSMVAGVGEVEIYKDQLESVMRGKEGIAWFRSDRDGEIRIRHRFKKLFVDTEYRLRGDDVWRHLHRQDKKDRTDQFNVVGFGPDPNDVLIYDNHEGRKALFRERLVEDDEATRTRELVFAHESVDVLRALRLGRNGRIVGVTYETDRAYVHYFDDRVKQASKLVHEEFPGLGAHFLDESWDRRFYLVVVEGDDDTGGYYRVDMETESVDQITRLRPHLDDETLAKMRAVSYPAADGTMIPGYLTLPPGLPAKNLPLVVMPHGGPESRDSWSFDWLSQYMAARGYAVLQANYRGSAGYGTKWMGDGAFNSWQKAVGDIDGGVKSLVADGIVDSSRMCTVGWSYGGYAALISAIEHPEQYRCVVSIAGVTHPHRIYRDRWTEDPLRRTLLELIPQDSATIDAGSPWRRASELTSPVLLLHGDVDMNVALDHSTDMARALKRAKTSVEFVEYEDTDHHFRRQSDRIDLLQRVGDFLDIHLAKKKGAAP